MDFFSNSHRRFSAVIAAAGSSERMGGNDKLFIDLEGLPVIVRTLNAVASVESIDKIILAVSAKNIDRTRDLLEERTFRKLIKVIEGGKTRQESVYAGVIEAESDFVLIHDGARPFITAGFIQSLLDETLEYDAVIPAIPVVDTIKRVDDLGMVSETIDRSNLFMVQTPQVIRRDVWLKAYEHISINRQIVTDDASMLESAGFQVKVVLGSGLNIKITSPDDILSGRIIINQLDKDG